MGLLNIFDLPYADSADWPLVRGPMPITIITAAYILFVMKYGKILMATRQPYQLRGVLQYYNLLQIVFNVFLFVSISCFLYYSSYDIGCLKPLTEDDPMKTSERLLSYLYYLNKIMDLMDTVFFILRKSYKQITVLHLFHHIYMSFVTYLVFRFYGSGGIFVVLGLLNSFVHSIMYGYYYLSARFPNLKNSIWWKKYITITQQTQFLFIVVHSFWTLYNPNCHIHPFPPILLAFVSLLMFAMFTNFYIQTYIKKKNMPVTVSKRN